jgi:shikimate kinase
MIAANDVVKVLNLNYPFSRMAKEQKVILTGFMGVGKSSVSRHLAAKLGWKRIDLDSFIELKTSLSPSGIIENEGEQRFREIETKCLAEVLEMPSPFILSLGGGTFTLARNRELIKAADCLTIWLEATFSHCWQNITSSRKKRPLAQNRAVAEALFNERQTYYCLADWHLIIRPGETSLDIANRIAIEILDFQ